MANRPIHVVESGGDSTGLKEFADGADLVFNYLVVLLHKETHQLQLVK